ncbi:MAG TPA: hypothetical protein P5186_21320 [Candidatus Paceibacterota bacterium]|nr:hypothetical protein [Verrucomicrobiota bacterium]HRY50599.1 hypothetical protein [Candidatus Paceibacterota bacterium]HSA00279.1 hypothetical protein [Candidatus Paceibacterota bacterium]
METIVSHKAITWNLSWNTAPERLGRGVGLAKDTAIRPGMVTVDIKKSVVPIVVST